MIPEEIVEDLEKRVREHYWSPMAVARHVAYELRVFDLQTIERIFELAALSKADCAEGLRTLTVLTEIDKREENGKEVYYMTRHAVETHQHYQEKRMLWVDDVVSSALPDMRLKGESQTIEFKRQIDSPDQLRREIASFGTAEGGDILIGIDDEGKVHGMSIDDVKLRDELWHRVDGIAHTVEPDVRYEILFGIIEHKVVACVSIPKDQDYPVFYSNEKPYIRDGRSSRPARPDEVVNCVLLHPVARESDQQRHRDLRYNSLKNIVESNARAREQHRSATSEMLNDLFRSE